MARNNCTGGSAPLGGEEKAGHDREGCVAGWQAVLGACLGSDVPCPPGCLGGEVETAFKRLLCPSAGSSARREMLWQHLIQGADVRGKHAHP